MFFFVDNNERKKNLYPTALCQKWSPITTKWVSNTVSSWESESGAVFFLPLMDTRSITLTRNWFFPFVSGNSLHTLFSGSRDDVGQKVEMISSKTYLIIWADFPEKTFLKKIGDLRIVHSTLPGFGLLFVANYKNFVCQSKNMQKMK